MQTIKTLPAPPKSPQKVKAIRTKADQVKTLGRQLSPEYMERMEVLNLVIDDEKEAYEKENAYEELQKAKVQLKKLEKIKSDLTFYKLLFWFFTIGNLLQYFWSWWDK